MEMSELVRTGSRTSELSVCCVGLVEGTLACLEVLSWLCGRLLQRPATCRVAPTIRERVLSRKKAGSDILDIHTLLVRPDPGRSLRKTYRTVGPLGKGGFGAVYRVQYLPTGEDRAIKMVPKPKERTELSRVLTEVQALISLDHPSIEKFFEFFEDAKVICLVTELCTGGNLGELDPADDGEEDIRLLFRDVVSAVAYCHSKGVAHRDLKFENCLLTKPEGKHTRRMAKIIDFGLSAVRPSSEKQDRWMGEAVGTAYFIAPEVLKSETGGYKYGPKCDTWSIGVMLYIVYTDQHPFARSAASAKAIIERVRRECVRTLPLDEAGVSRPCKDLIMGLLHRDVSKRLSAEAALHHEYFRVPSTASSSNHNTPKTTPKSMRGILKQVCSFARYTRFERAILTLVAHDIQVKEVEDLRAAFISLDSSRAGWLSRDGVCAALKASGIKLNKEELETAFEALDPDGDDKVQYTDWLAATIRPATLTSERAMKEIFDFFDIHGVGKVNRADIAEVLGEEVLGTDLPLGVTLDSNGDISWEQFQGLLTQVARNLQVQVDAALSSKEHLSRRSWLLRKISGEREVLATSRSKSLGTLL